MSAVLDYLFESKAKARLLRFFLLNFEREYTVSELAKRNILQNSQVRKELANLKRIRFVIERHKGREKHYLLNKGFALYPELRNLIVKSNVYPQTQSLAKVKSIGDVKLALVSGIFLNYPKSKADIVLIVNNVNRARLRKFMNNLEAEIGKEVSYVLMNSDEFKYRLDMLDRFLLDFLESPHDEIVNRIPGLRRLIMGLKK